MTIASVGSLGTAADTGNNQTQSQITLSAALEAGNAAVLCVAVDNNQTTDGDEGAVTGVVDSAGNTWLKAGEFTNGQGSAQAGATISVWYCERAATTVAIGGTITASFNNSASRDASTATAWEYSLNANSRLTLISGSPGTLANDNADPGSLNFTTPNLSALRVRAIAGETNSTTALTVTTNFTAMTGQRSGSGTAAGEMTVRAEFRINTATSSASDPTYVSADMASIYVAFKESYYLPCDQGSYTLTGQAATFKRGYGLIAAVGTYTLTGRPAGFVERAQYHLGVAAIPVASFPVAGRDLAAQAYVVGANVGTYALTGQAVALKADRKIAAAQGSYSLSGQVVVLVHNYPMTAGQGSYSLTGRAVGLSFGHVAGVAHGSYTLGGQAVTLTEGSNRLAANFGSYTVNGFGASLAVAAAEQIGVAATAVANFPTAGFSFELPEVAAGFSIVGSHGTYTLTGQSLVLREGYSLNAATGFYEHEGSESVADYTFVLDAGTYTLTGQAAGLVLITDPEILAAFGSYTLTGQSAALVKSRVFAAGQGSYTLTGLAAILKPTRSIVASHGSYALSGQAVALRASRSVLAAQGSYSLSGQAVGLSYGHKFPAAFGSYALTGQTVLFARGRPMLAAFGSYSLTGQTANFVTTRHLAGDFGAYTLTGLAATLTVAPSANKLIGANVGLYDVLGQSITLLGAHRIALEGGTYALSGQAATLAQGRVVQAAFGSYAVSGQATTLDFARRITAVFGAYALSGQDVEFRVAPGLLAGVGLYVINGQGVTLLSSEAGNRFVTGLIGRVANLTELSGRMGGLS